jgi:hypothetical protein
LTIVCVEPQSRVSRNFHGNRLVTPTSNVWRVEVAVGNTPWMAQGYTWRVTVSGGLNSSWLSSSCCASDWQRERRLRSSASLAFVSVTEAYRPLVHEKSTCFCSPRPVRAASRGEANGSRAGIAISTGQQNLSTRGNARIARMSRAAISSASLCVRRTPPNAQSYLGSGGSSRQRKPNGSNVLGLILPNLGPRTGREPTPRQLKMSA